MRAASPSTKTTLRWPAECACLWPVASISSVRSRTTATAAVSAYARAMCPVPPATSKTAAPGSAGTFLCIQAIRRRSVKAYSGSSNVAACLANSRRTASPWLVISGAPR